MVNIYKEIFAQVEAELDYARNKWGSDFDDKNTLNDWAAYTINYLGQALRMDADKDKQEVALLKTIGLLVNALARVKNDDVAKRHYDKDVK